MDGVERRVLSQHDRPRGTTERRPLDGVTIAHLGHFDPGYARNRIMAKALTRAGATVRVVSDERAFLHRTPRLLRALMRTPTDLLLVGFPGHSDVPLARAVARWEGGPVLFDAFVSRYETGEDRGTAPSRSVRALRRAESRTLSPHDRRCR